MKSKKTYYIISGLLLTAAALGSTACSDDPLYSGNASTATADSGDRIYFHVNPPASAEVVITSRAEVEAQSKEKDIYALRIMIFSASDSIIPDEVFTHFDNQFSSTVFGPKSNQNITTTQLETQPKFDYNRGFSIPVIYETVYYRDVTTTTTAADGTSTSSTSIWIVDNNGNPISGVFPTDATLGKIYTLDSSKLKGCHIWVFANMGRWEYSLVNHNSDDISSLDDIKTLEELRRFYGRRYISSELNGLDNQDVFGTTRPFLPMVGTIKYDDTKQNHIPVIDKDKVIGTDLTFDALFRDDPIGVQTPSGYEYDDAPTLDLTTGHSIGDPVVIPMDQIVAKVRFRIQMPQEEVNVDKTIDGVEYQRLQSLKWEFYFDNWSVEGLPRYTYIIPHKKDIADYVTKDAYAAAAFGDGATGTNNPAVNRGLYLPIGLAEFSHNGFGDGSVTNGSNDTDWIGPYAPVMKDVPNSDGTTESIQDYDGNGNPKYYGISPNFAAEEDANEGPFVNFEDGQYYYHFYTYGNRRGGRAAAPNKDNLSGTAYNEAYNSSVTEKKDAEGNDTPYYKTLYAPDNATFLILTGIVRRTIIDKDGVEHRESRSVCFKIAIGGNQTNDYNVYRNTCYTLNIHINGFTQNDLKVTYDTDDGRYYNSSVHRRFQMAIRSPYLDQIDCHYDRRYIQFTGVADQENKQDIRMRIYSSYEEAVTELKTADGSTTIAYGSEAYQKPDWLKIERYSDGAHDFETMGNGLENVELTDVFSSGSNEVNFCLHAHEYLGENPREAWLQIRHSYRGSSDVLTSLTNADKDAQYYGIAQRMNADGSPATDTDKWGNQVNIYDVYTYRRILQYGPIRLATNLDERNKVSWPTDVIFIERFLEYTMPLDPGVNATPVSGLPWGWSRYNDSKPFTLYKFTPKDSPKDDTTPQNSNVDGLFNTGILAKLTKDESDVTNIFTRYSFNGDYAARYCYDKGAGIDAEGKDHHDWYLPSIEELNYLTAYCEGMTTNPDYGGNGGEGDVYWSSTTYTDPNSFPDVLVQYYNKYHNGKTPYTYIETNGSLWAWEWEQKTVYGWEAAWRDANSSLYIYRTWFGQFVGDFIGRENYSINYFLVVWNTLELEEDETSPLNPFNCAEASCNGLRYLEGYDRTWNADNTENTTATNVKRSSRYHVRAIRAGTTTTE